MVKICIRVMVWMFVYTCVATVLALSIGVTYLWGVGTIDEDKAFQVLALLHGVDVKQEQEKRPSPRGEVEQPSYEETQQARTLNSLHLDLKTQALNRGLEELRVKQQDLIEDRNRYRQVTSAFEARLAQLNDTSLQKGVANVRLIWESISPELAKEQMLKMIEAGEIDDVVVILTDMPRSKQARIVGQFTDPEEAEAMDEVLRLIRQGEPKISLIDRTRDQLQGIQ